MKISHAIAAVTAIVITPAAYAFVGSFPGVRVMRDAAPRSSSTMSRSQQKPVMLFGGGGSKPAESGGEKKEGFNMGNMMEGLKKANEIGQKTKDLQKDLELLKVEGTSPCGMVKVTVTGQQMPVGCDISDEAMAEGSKAVGEKVTAAMAQAHSQSLQVMSKRLAELYSEMGLPLGQMPGGMK